MNFFIAKPERVALAEMWIFGFSKGTYTITFPSQSVLEFEYNFRCHKFFPQPTAKIAVKLSFQIKIFENSVVGNVTDITSVTF